MILFTGSGSLAAAYKKKYNCKVLSVRKLNDEELISWIEKAKVIIHNSALINSNSIQELLESNVVLTQRILNLAYKFNPTVKFVNISSMSFLKTWDTCKDAKYMNNYAFSKFTSEQLCLRHDLKDLTNVRFSTLFYKDKNKDGISKLIADAVKYNEITLLNDGLAKRDVLPLTIAVDYLNKITKIEHSNKTINLVNGHAISFRDIANILKRDNDTLVLRNQVVDIVNPPILSDFSKKDVRKLGQIKFDLGKEILNYKKILHENSNI
jgi:nucleoside-diphosphate-sugar epimerase